MRDMAERSNILPNKQYRELLETRNVFADPGYCREAWKSVGMAVLLSESNGMVISDGKEGQIEEYTYAKLTKELKELGRKPTELEMILHCQAAKARWDTSAAVFLRDSSGGKPIDESRIEVRKNAYEDMSDEELEVLLRYRAQKGEGGGTYEGTYEGTYSAPTGTGEVVEHSGDSIPTADSGDSEEHTATIADSGRVYADGESTAPTTEGTTTDSEEGDV